METSPFQPAYGNNQVLAAGAVSATAGILPASKSIRIVNSGANIAYFRVGEGAQTATVADCPILSGQSIIVEKGDGDNNIGYISALTTTLQVQSGEGGQ